MATKKPKTATSTPQSQPETQAPDTPKADMIQLGGLWANRTKDGEIYFSGYLGNAKLLIFKNKFKTEDKHPAFVMYVAPNPKNNSAPTQDDIEKDLSADIPF
ncbi:MAG: hypothetical protein AAFN11_03705 [Chloroflexota bacterium]